MLVLGSARVEDTLGHTLTPIFSVDIALLCFLVPMSFKSGHLASIHFLLSLPGLCSVVFRQSTTVHQQDVPEPPQVLIIYLLIYLKFS